MNISAEFVQSSNLDINLDEQDVNIDMGQQIARGFYETPTIPIGGQQGDLLRKRTDEDYDTEWIAPANDNTGDNTRPVTAAAMYMEIGNINALLSTI